MTPGRYVRDCRQAAGLSIEEVALRLDSVPHVSARSRGEWLLHIEGDHAPISVTTALALSQLHGLGVELETLAGLIDDEHDATYRLVPAARPAQPR